MMFDFSQVYGQIEEEGDSEHFEFSHSYSAIHQPPDKIEPDGKFFSFEHYNVEVRKRVKCITAVEGVYVKLIKPRHEKTNVLHMRKQRRRSASR